MSKICYKCHKKNFDDDVFCKNCGTRLEINCPSCGAKIEGDKYCSHCGTQLVETNLSKTYRIVQEVYHQSFNRQCSCGATNKPNVKYCTQCGKRVFLTKMQKLKILMNILIFVVCISLIPISWSTIKWLSRSTVSDSEGNVYRTVKIGNQLWMNDNLRSSRLGEYPIAKSTLSSVKEAYICYSGGDSNNVARLGYFYNWTAASANVKMEKSDLYHKEINGICPYGWHLPTRDDIESLYNSGKHLKSSNGQKNELYWSSSGNVFSNQGIEYDSWRDCTYYRYDYDDCFDKDGFPNNAKCSFYEPDSTDETGDPFIAYLGLIICPSSDIGGRYHYVRCVRDEPINEKNDKEM